MSGDSSSTGDTTQDMAGKKQTKRYAWGPLAAVLIVFGSFLVIPAIVELTLMWIPPAIGWDTVRAQDWATNSPVANFLYVLCTEVLTVGFVYWFVRGKKVSFRVAAALGKPKWRDIGHALLGLLIYFGLFTLIYAAVSQIFTIDQNQKQALGFEQGVNGVGLWLAFVSLVILPPIAEEIMFRGFFYGTLRSFGVQVWPSIIATTTLFASLHLFGAVSGGLLWSAFVDVFSLSIVLCYLREQNGTIWSSIGVHALKNGFVFLNLFIIHAR